MGARRHGQKDWGTCAPENVVKCFQCYKMLSKVPVDEVFMHHFEKMSSASVGFPQTLTGGLSLDHAGGRPSFKPPHCPLPNPGKDPASAHDDVCGIVFRQHATCECITSASLIGVIRNSRRGADIGD